MVKGYHIHRQRLYLDNFELLNCETLDYYDLLCETGKWYKSIQKTTLELDDFIFIRVR